jgi:hypothetical protein
MIPFSPSGTIRYDALMRFRTYLIILGILNLLLYFLMSRLSLEFNWGEGYRDRPIPTYLVLYGALFTIFALAVWGVRKFADHRGNFWVWVLLGLLFRAVLLPAHQIQEDDIYRYLWDGKVFAHNINPYRYSPEEVGRFKEFMISEPTKFRETYTKTEIEELTRLYQLKWDNETSLIFQERINHPHVPTIYPPLAQYVFRLVHQIQPDSILTMRLMFGVFDLVALGFIVALLASLGLNRNWALIYFWCPLVIKETYNSTHLDIIGVAMLCGSLFHLVRGRHLMAMGFLALSVVGKLYSVILLPFFMKTQWTEARKQGKSPWQSSALGLLVFAGMVAFFYAPFLGIGEKAFVGLQTFGTYWQSNDSIFALFVWFFRTVLGLDSSGPVGFSYDLPSLLSKVTVMAILAGTLLYLLVRPPREEPPRARQAAAGSMATLKAAFIIMGLVFLLSPVQNPWYLCWIVPFLCVFPSRAWILLTGLVGLYYLDFYFDYQDLMDYSIWLPWYEYLPFYMLLLWDFLRSEKTLPRHREIVNRS